MSNKERVLAESLLKVNPFNKLSDEGKNLVYENISYDYYEIGERIYRSDTLPYKINYIVKGEARLLVQSQQKNSLITLEKIGPGALIGWIGLIRGGACETIQASKDVECVSLQSDIFIRLCLTESKFLLWYGYF